MRAKLFGFPLVFFISSPLQQQAGLSLSSLGGCSTSHQLCAVLGGSQVTAKLGFRREEGKVRAVRPLVCSSGAGLDVPRCHHPLLQVPQPSSHNGKCWHLAHSCQGRLSLQSNEEKCTGRAPRLLQLGQLFTFPCQKCQHKQGEL